MEIYTSCMGADDYFINMHWELSYFINIYTSRFFANGGITIYNVCVFTMLYYNHNFSDGRFVSNIVFVCF